MHSAFRRCSAALVRSANTARPTGYAVSALRASPYLRSGQLIRGLPIASVSRIHQSAIRLDASSPAIYEIPDQVEQNDSTTLAPATRFLELEERGTVHPSLIRAITERMKLETMTDVQIQTIDSALRDEDMVAQAKTGTGKTLAFLIPVLQNIIKSEPRLAIRRGRPRTTPDDIRAIIIAPSRELAEQIAEEARKVTYHTNIIVQAAVGGTMKRQMLQRMMVEGCHVLVGTPGRIMDILSDPFSRVAAPKLSTLVYDEADRLLDSGFKDELAQIVEQLPKPDEQPRQTLLFSATVPPEVRRLIQGTLRKGYNYVNTVPANEPPTHERVEQKFVLTRTISNFMPTLVELFERELKASAEPDARPFKAIIYFNSTAEVQLAEDLFRILKTRRPGSKLSSTPVFGIHSKLTQARRTQSSEMFRRSKSGILVSSDVTARGMDFPNVSHVIQVGAPNNRESYIHRIGRTGRAGKEGVAWLITSAGQENKTRSMLRRLPLKRDRTLEAPLVDVLNPEITSEELSELLNAVRSAHTRVFKDTLGSAHASRKNVLSAFYADNRELEEELAENLEYWGITPPSTEPVKRRFIGRRDLSADVEEELDDSFTGVSYDSRSREPRRYGDRNSRGFGDRGSGRSGGFGGRSFDRSGGGDERPSNRYFDKRRSTMFDGNNDDSTGFDEAYRRNRDGDQRRPRRQVGVRPYDWNKDRGSSAKKWRPRY